MRGDVENAPEHIQLLKRELDLSRILRRRKHWGGLIGGEAQGHSDGSHQERRNGLAKT